MDYTNGQAFHAAACGVLGIGPGYGSQRVVADALGVGAPQYSSVRSGREGSLGTLRDWARTLGLVMVCDAAVRFVGTPQDAVSEAGRMLDHAAALVDTERDHPTVDAELHAARQGLSEAAAWLGGAE